MTTEELTNVSGVTSIVRMQQRESLLSKVQERRANQYSVYEFRLKFRNRCVGGIGRDLDMQLASVRASIKSQQLPEATAKRILEDTRARFAEQEEALRMRRDELGLDAAQDAEANEAEAANRAEKKAIEKRWTVFWFDVEGLYLESRCLKSGLREVMSKLGFFQNATGSKGAHDYGLFVEPYRLRFERAGEVLTVADGHMDGPITTPTASGKITALKRADYVEAAEMPGRLAVLCGGKVTEVMLIEAWALLQDAGIGAMRSQGYGQFDLIQFDRVQVGEPSAVKSKAQRDREAKAKKDAKTKAKAEQAAK